MYKNLQKNYKNPVKKVVVRRMGIEKRKLIASAKKAKEKRKKNQNALDKIM